MTQEQINGLKTIIADLENMNFQIEDLIRAIEDIINE